MDRTCIFVGYNGRWNEENRYVDYRTHLILIKYGITLDAFVQTICEKLVIDKNENEPTIWFDTKIQGNKGMLLRTDDDLEACIYLVKSEAEYKKAHFIVETEKEHQATTNTRPVYCETIDVESCCLPTDVEQRNDKHPSSLMDVACIEPLDTVVEIKKLKGKKKEARQVEILRENASLEDIKLYSIFESKEKLKKCIANMAISRRFEFKVKRSSKKRLVLKCADDECNWQLNAFQVRDSSLFKIVKCNNIHHCFIDSDTSNQRHVTSRLISDLVKDKVHDPKSNIKPADVINEMQRTHGVTISYKKAHRALELANASIRGTPEENYMLLPSYLHMMKQQNPGTYTNTEWGEDERFKYAFFAYGASIDGWKHCRPVIIIDATYLKAKYGGLLMIAISKDGNNDTYPIAFGIADSETDQSWEWFITQMKQAIGNREKLTILSDRNQSIQDAILKIYPDCLHGICAYHLEQKLKAKFRNSAAIYLFYGAVRAYRHDEFHYFMNEITKIDAKIATYLMEEPPERWSHSYSTRLRCNLVTKNIVESMNETLDDTRDLPVLSLIDEIQNMLQRWFSERKQNAEATSRKMSNWAENELEKKIDVAFRLNVFSVDAHLVTVMDCGKQFIVDLAGRTCTCLQFNLDGVPCSHAIAAIEDKVLPKSDFCSQWFDKEHLVKTYEGHILPVGDKNTWVIPEEIKQKVTNPPLIKHLPGRRQKQQDPSVVEFIKTKMKCSRCKRKGHTRTQCTFSPTVNHSPKKHKAN